MDPSIVPGASESVDGIAGPERPTATRAVLLITCPDRRGLVAKLAGFIAETHGNILHADHHIDTESGLFLMRVEWDLSRSLLSPPVLAASLRIVATDLGAEWDLFFDDAPLRLAIFVTRQDHCLQDLVWRFRSGDLAGEIAMVFSNHRELQSVAEAAGIPFHHFPISAECRNEVEEREIALLTETRVDLVVLARYMQIVSERFVSVFPNRIINIHHSFLPAFPGAQPYHQAARRGVKIIGATAHYVTSDLDAGPIIEQDVTRISHRDEVSDLIRKGKDLERVVLARAVRHHIERRVLVYRNRTAVFA